MTITVDVRGAKKPFSEDKSGSVRALKTESTFEAATRLGWQIVDSRLDISSLSELSTKKYSSPGL